MAVLVRYHVGGYLSSAPQKNQAELHDSTAGTVTTWNPAGVQTSQRALTAAEAASLAAQDAEHVTVANKTAIEVKASAALTTNAAALALPDPTAGNTTYLAIGAPTNPQVTGQVRALTNQNNALVAQTRALTRQNNQLIRLALNFLDDTAGT